MEIGGIAFLEAAVGQAELFGAHVAGGDEDWRRISTPGDISCLSCLAAGMAVVPSPQPKVEHFGGFGQAEAWVDERLAAFVRMLCAKVMRVKSPFSQSALFGLVGVFMLVGDLHLSMTAASCIRGVEFDSCIS